MVSHDVCVVSHGVVCAGSMCGEPWCCVCLICVCVVSHFPLCAGSVW